MENNLINTDAGLLTIENARYLCDVGVIDEEGHILYKLINKSAFTRPVQLWSMFCLIKEDIAKTLGIYRLNAIVDVMRNGEIGGEKEYPKVMDFIQKGSQLALEAMNNGKHNKSRKDDFIFDDD